MIDLFRRRRLFVLSFFAVFALVLGVAAMEFSDQCVHLYWQVRRDLPRNQPSRLAPWPESDMGMLRYLVEGGSLAPGTYSHFKRLAWAALVGLVGLLGLPVSRGRGRSIVIAVAAILLVHLVLDNFWIPMTANYEGPEGLASIFDLGCMIVVAYAGYCLYVARDEFRRCAELPTNR